MTDQQQPAENVFKQASPLDDIGDVWPPIAQDNSKEFGPASGPTVLNTVADSFAPQGRGTGASAMGTALQEMGGPARFATPLDDIGDIAPSDVSASGAAARGAVRGALPAAGSLAAAGAGAEAGAAAGAFVGPWSAAAGGLLGGLGGAVAGGAAVDAAQSWMLSKLPDSFVDAFGQGERQQRLDQQERPVASFVGGMIPFALTMQPSKLALSATALPEGATALQTLMANPVTARLFGGAVMGGMELGTEAVHGEVDWRKVGISTGFGIVFNKPNRLGEAITEMGAAPARRIMGRPVTVAQAGDAKVMGPGITEAVFQGTHEQAPEAAMTAHEAARAEHAAMGEHPEPNPVEIARTMEPELFARYDDLQARQKAFGAQIGPGGEEIPALDSHLAATTAELEKMAPEIAAAYRRAADTMGVETAEAPQFKSFAEMLAAREAGTDAKVQNVPLPEQPGAVPGVPGVPPSGEAAGAATGPAVAPGAVPPRPQRSIGDQRAFIAEDTARRLIAAGRPEAEARAAGQLVAARYVTRAGRFEGKLGSAEDIYSRESAAIAGPNGRALAPAAPPRDAYEAAGPVQSEAHDAAEQPARELAAKPPTEPGILAHDFDTADRIKNEWRKSATYKETEPFIEASWHNQRALSDAAEQIGADLGLTFKNPGIKARSTADIASITDAEKRAKAEKGYARLQTKAKKHGIGGVTDQVRGGFDVETPEQADQALAKLGQKFQIVDEGWRETPDGYFDRKAYIRFPDGMIGELQFWPPGMLEAKDKGGGHELYEQSRELPQGHPDISGFSQKMRDLYGPLRAGLPEEWKAVLGNGGKGPNLLPNSSGESTRPLWPTSMGLAHDHLPPENTQASASEMKNGSPSNEPALMADMTGPPAGKVGTPEEVVNGQIYKEEDGPEPPADGRVMVYRIGSASGGLSNRNAGNIRSIATHLSSAFDDERPQSAGGLGNVISAYTVDLPKETGPYQRINAKGAQEAVKTVGREAKKHGDGVYSISYSFPEGVEGQRVSSISLDQIKSILKEMGFNHPGEAGTLEMEQAIKAAAERNQGAPAATVNASVAAADKINDLTPAQQKRELPAYAPDKERAAAGPDQPAGVFMFSPTALDVDAKRFQFKSGGDEYGVTGALRNVTKWDPAKAQAIIVWEQEDGKLFVADGHQRAGLARRLTEQGKAKDVQLPGILYREKDGISADDIRAIAAVTNIANGSGSALDGAKVLRARPDLMDGSLPLSVGKGKQSAALARLGDEAFRMVVNDVVPEHYAAVVGELIPKDPERQVAALKAIARFEPKNADEAAVLTQRVAQAELAKREEGAQTSMFGDLETKESTAGEEMKIVGRAIADLKKDKALFARVLKNAERIEETGSQIERGAAQSIATDAEVFAKTLTSEAYTAGPIRQELIAAARDLKDGKSSIGEASERIVAALRQQAEAHGADRAGAVGQPEQAKEFAQREFAKTEDFEGYPVEKGDLSHDLHDEWKQAEKDLKEDGEEIPASPALRLALKKFDDLIKHNDAGHVIMPDQIPGVIAALEKAKADIAAKFETGGKATAKSLSGKVLESSIDNEIAALRNADKDLHAFFAEEGAKFEPGAEGKPQGLIPGVAPVTQRDLIQAAANKPLAPKKAQKAADFGLFGSEKDQKELFQIARGTITIGKGRPLIKLLKEANSSTFIHETGHEWLEQMVKDSGHADAPAVIRDDMQTIRDWLGVKDEIQTKHHEKFARGFEQYLREGVAPSQGLAKVFADFRNWLLTIYQSLRGLGTEISPEIRGVFDRMLEMEPQRTVIAPERLQPDLLHDIHEAEATHTPPHEAEPAMDRIIAERDRYISEQPPEIQRELEAAASKVQIAEGPAGEAHGAPGEAFASPGGSGQVGEGGGGPGSEPGGGGSGAEHGAQQPGGSGAGAEGAAGARPDTRSELGRDPGTALAPGPVDLFGTRDTAFVDKSGRILIEKLNTSDDVTRALLESAAANDSFIGDRRGVVTDGQVIELAHELGMDGAERLVRDHVTGRAYNAEQTWALRELLKQAGAEMHEAAKKAADGNPADILAFAEAKQKVKLIHATVAGARAESGRGQRAWRKMPGDATVEAMAKFATEETGQTLNQLLVEAKLAAQYDTSAKINKLVRDQRSIGGMLLEIWINGLLSGLSTHATNVISNTVFMVQHFGPERLVAGLIGGAARAAGREGPHVTVGELGAIARGAKEGLAPALQATGTAFRKGASTLLPGEEGTPGGLLDGMAHDELSQRGVLNESATWHDVASGAFGAIRGNLDAIVAGGALVKAGGAKGAPLWELKYTPGGQVPDIGIKGMTVPVGSLVRSPGRFLSTMDTFFRSLNYAMAKSATAYRMATEEGLTGTAFSARVADIRNNPTAEVMEAARTEASSTTFMDRGGEWVRALNSLVNKEVHIPGVGDVKPLKFVMPFTNVVSRILDQSLVKRTPLGIAFSQELRNDLLGKNGNVAQETAAARMLVGSTLMLGFGSLAAQGFITGSGPKDPKEAAVWRLTHQPHSVKIGSIYYDIGKLGPMGLLASMAADLHEVERIGSEDDVAKAGSYLMNAIVQNVLDQSVLQGPAELIKAIETPEQYGPQYIKSFLSSFVPNAINNFAKSRDPYIRQTWGVLDEIKNRLPGYREELHPKIDLWGQPVPTREALGGTGVTAVYMQKVNSDPVNITMSQLGMKMGPVEKKIRNVELAPQEYEDYARVAGVMTKQNLDRMVLSPSWDGLPPGAKQQAVTHIIETCRETARGIIMARYPHIPREAAQQKVDTITTGKKK